MLRIFLSVSAVFFLFSVKAQNAFVEVSVEDTVHTIPQEIIYQVTRVDGDTIDSTTATTTFSTTTPPPGIDPVRAVRKLISFMHLDTLADDNYIVTNNSYDENDHRILIRFTSFDQLKAFTKELRKVKSVVGSISNVKPKNVDEQTKVLLERLYLKAKEKAEVLALLAHKKLGSVLSIKEQHGGSGWTMYPPLSSVIPGWHTTLSNDVIEESVIIQRNLVVQFNWQ